MASCNISGLRTNVQQKLAIKRVSANRQASLSTNRRQNSVTMRSKVEDSQWASVDLIESEWKEKVIENKAPVIVDFWAPWCGPCRQVMPIIDELSAEYKGQIAVFKVNTDDQPKIASEYGIRSIPTIIIFNQGERMETVIGAVKKNVLKDTMDKYVNSF